MIIAPGGFGGGFGNGRGTAPPFAAQRLMLWALLLGMVFYAVVVGVVLGQQDWVGLADQPLPILDSVVLGVGGAAVVAAVVMRSVLQGRAAAADAEQRSGLQFQARLVPQLWQLRFGQAWARAQRLARLERFAR